MSKPIFIPENTTKSRKQYVAAWRSHIRELVRPVLDSNCLIEDWEEIESKLNKIIAAAAEDNFPKENHSEL